LPLCWTSARPRLLRKRWGQFLARGDEVIARAGSTPLPVRAARAGSRAGRGWETRLAFVD
jgi:hypothetical protein